MLLPDGRVLTAGQGEGGYFLNHPDYQVFSPPYLFAGPRPQLTQAPTQVVYRQSFGVPTPDAGSIRAVSWVRLSSVTHSFSMNQRLNHLAFAVASGGLTLTAPGTPEECPPGQYMLFLLNANGVPSLARTITIGPAACVSTLSLAQYTIDNANCVAQVQVVASSSSPVTSYRWAIDGTYESRFDGQDVITLQLSNVVPTQTVDVTVTPTCGGQPLTSSKVVTQYFPGCAAY